MQRVGIILGLVQELLTSSIWLRINRILDAKPELAHDNHPSILTALQVTVVNRAPAGVDPILPQLNATPDVRSSWDDEPYIFSRRKVPPRPCGSTPLHYACLLGDMKMVEVLLRNSAEWTISDGDGLLPEDYASVNGDGKLQEFKRLCEEQTLRCREEEELGWAGRFAKELELEREEERLKKLELQKEVEKKKLGEEEVLNRHNKQRKWFLPTTNYTYRSYYPRS